MARVNPLSNRFNTQNGRNRVKTVPNAKIVKMAFNLIYGLMDSYAKRSFNPAQPQRTTDAPHQRGPYGLSNNATCVGYVTDPFWSNPLSVGGSSFSLPPLAALPPCSSLLSDITCLGVSIIDSIRSESDTTWSEDKWVGYEFIFFDPKINGVNPTRPD
jgi:hypothetical protein